MSDDTIYRRAALDALCDNCDNAQAVCAHYPCEQYIAVEKLPSARHFCRDCKWVKYQGSVDKYGNVESYWRCYNWDGETDEEGFCHEWEGTQ